MTKSTAFHTLILITSLNLGALIAFADVPESDKHEVRHLLEFVRTTGCAFERNGKTHSGGEASKHIKRKYKHYRGKITTTEEFIEYAGTKSTMSGKDYLVYCDSDAPVKSKDWLLEELKVYRQQVYRTPFVKPGLSRNADSIRRQTKR